MGQLYSGCCESDELTLSARRPAGIAAALGAIDVRYAHVDLAAVGIDVDAETDEIIEAYRDDLDGLIAHEPWAEIEVLSVLPGHPHMAALAREFMSEHAHGVAEAQLLVWGYGILFMRVPQRVFALYCESGDFVALPAGLFHWFELNRASGLRTLRLFGANAAQARIQRGRDMRDVFSLSAPIDATHRFGP